MNEFLAQLYGTRENIGAEGVDSDVEKLAEAQILDEFLTNEGVDIDTLDGETILKVANDLFGDESALLEGEAVAEEPSEDEMTEKLAEADFLGRAMAHAFVDEQNNLSKEAGGALEALKTFGGTIRAGAKDVGSKIHGGAERLGERLTPAGASEHMGMRAMKGHEAEMVKRYAKKKGIPRENAAAMLNDVTKLRKGVMRGAGAKAEKATSTLHKAVGYGVPAAGVGAVGAGGYALSKKSSALDSLAEQRALEILQEAQESPQEKLAGAVEERAWELLSENGYTE